MTRISLALVGLMWVVPFLLTTHEYPLTTFDQEWWTALLGVSAMFAMVGREFWSSPSVPRITLLPIGLVFVAVLQMALGKIAYYEQGLLYIQYLLFAALLMILGAWLRRSVGLVPLALTLAAFLLIGTELGAAVGVLQHFGWHTWFDSLVVRKVSYSLYGNVAQPNHYADYISLGLISLGLLFQYGKLRWLHVLILVVPLLFVLTLAGSRSAWIYLVYATLLAFLYSGRTLDLKKTKYFMLALLAGFALMHLLVQLPFLAGAGEETDTWRRLMNSDTNGSARLYLWREALVMFQQHPFVGVGFGQFALHHLALLPVLDGGSFPGLYNNAHNVLFQLAAETGLSGLLIFVGALLPWFLGLRSATAKHAVYFWGYGVLGIMAIHSLLEYPLWYAYFIAIISLLLGVFDEKHFSVELRLLGRAALALILCMGIAVLLQTKVAYVQLKSVLNIKQVSASNEEKAMRMYQGLYALQAGSMVSPYAKLFLAAYTDVSPKNVDSKLSYNQQAMSYIPTSDMVYRQSFLLAQAGRMDEAKVLMVQAIWSYPGNGNAHQKLLDLSEKDPAHFSALLEFATQKEQEHARAVRIR